MIASTHALRPMEVEYEELKNFIGEAVNRFWNRFGGDREEYESEADVIFVRAYNDYVKKAPDKPFHTWLGYWLYYELIDRFVRPYARRKRKTTVKAVGEAIDMAATHDTTHWLHGISEEAQIVVHLTLNAPADLVAAARLKGGTPRNFRSCLRSYLEAAEWSGKRISETFEEIATAMNA